jgi:2-dehydro-3-deoxygluconokinase
VRVEGGNLARKIDLVTLGETMLCLTGEGTGSLATVTTFRASIGGAESNTAIGLARLGLRAEWLSRVSTDTFGQHILREVKTEGVDVSAVVRDDRPTGLMLKERHAPTDVEVHYYRSGSAAAALDVPDVDEDRITASRSLHLTGVTLALGPGPRRAVLHAAGIAAGAGVPVSFDPNLRLKLWPLKDAVAACEELYPYVTDLLCNEQEACWLTGAADPLEAGASLAERGFERVVVKRGEYGAVGFSDGSAVQCPAVRARVVDVVGAGDAFNAGYLYGRLTGAAFRRSLEIGAWAAGQVVTHWGDYEGFPSAEAYRAWSDGGFAATRGAAL